MIEWFWHIMCLCYFAGGVTIGWWWNEYRHKKKNSGNKTGTGRWDWSNRTYKPDGDYP